MLSEDKEMATDKLKTILTQARQLSTDELAQLIKQATDMLAQSSTAATQSSMRYASLFGSGKGSFANQAEADRFIRGERDAWDE
jgi:hypothetical protein